MNRNLMWLLPVGVLAGTAQIAYATQYLNVESAQKIIFPEGTEFRSTFIRLTPEQEKLIKAASKTGTPLPDKTIWEVKAGQKTAGWFVTDQVYGKHEFITYAVGIDLTGAIRRIEIMDYRETHGSQVRDVKWRDQFIGKKANAPLQLENDIRNISGATLSCLHVAEGVRRVLAIHEHYLKKIVND